VKRMVGYSTNHWERPGDEDIESYDSLSTEFATAATALDRLIEKARRFYQSGDYEEVVLNAHLIKELYRLCLQEEYRRGGRFDFNPALRAKIEKNADLLDHWWESGIVTFQKIRIGPEIAKSSLALSEEMRNYVVAYINEHRAGASLSTQATRDGSFYDNQYDTKWVSAPRPTFPVIKGGLNVDDTELLYLARPSILGCTLKHKGLVLLAVFLLFGSFFVQNLVDISLIATALRGVAVLLFLFVVVRTALTVYSERYGITSQNISIEKGLFLKKTVVVPLNRIAKHVKQQTFSERLLRTGNVFIKTTSGHTLVFKEIYDPEEVAVLIAELRESTRPISDYRNSMPLR
jgi:membrane protein YdbS with pleckstrin-like domain